ncbi:hypothetical protein ACHAWF_004303 [Thalassiosira exigua]
MRSPAVRPDRGPAAADVPPRASAEASGNIVPQADYTPPLQMTLRFSIPCILPGGAGRTVTTGAYQRDVNALR